MSAATVQAKATSPSSALEPDQIRVITYNTAVGNPRITTPQEAFLELPFYREALAGETGAAILALQEVGSAQARALSERAAGGRFHLLQKSRPGQGNALVIPDRYELLHSRRRYYKLSHLRGVLAGLRDWVAGRRRPDLRQLGELRMWIEARLRERSSGRVFTVLNTHISAEPSLKLPQTRKIVARAHAAARHGPVVLAGDLNLKPGNPAPGDAEIEALLADFREMGTAAPSRRPNIDYVLALGFEPVSSRIWEGDSLQLPGQPDAESVSDHYAEDDVLRFSEPGGPGESGRGLRAMLGRRDRDERGAHQVSLTARATVRGESVDELRDVLERMGGEPAGTPGPPFPKLAGVHFARLLLLEDSGEPPDLIPASLVWMSEIDAPLERHLEELADVGGPALDATFGLCEGYPADPTPQTRRAYLGERLVESAASYVNTVGRTVDQIEREAELREAIEGFLDRRWGGGLPARTVTVAQLRAEIKRLVSAEPRGSRAVVREAIDDFVEGERQRRRSGLPQKPQQVRKEIQRFVRGEPSLSWARRRAPRPSLRWRLGELLHGAGVAAGLVLAAPLVVVLLPIYALVLRLHERADAAPHERPTAEHERRLAAIEDHLEVTQNQFSAIGQLKPGRFRRLTTQAVLWLTDQAARHVFTRASLAGIKTIHFAHWTPLEDWRRVLFTSNYDGSHESYMDDFIDKVAFGLNASFSNGVGYPKTRFLFFEGAQREQEFKDWQRRHQAPTQVWYSAYPQLSAANIENNALIRSGLFGVLNRQETEAWLRRL